MWAKGQVGPAAGLVVFLWAGVAPSAEADRSSPETPRAGATASDPSSPAPRSQRPSASPVAYIGVPSGYRRATTWDLNLDGALGAVVSGSSMLAGFGRVRAGVLWVRDADVFALGATYEYASIEKVTVGIQAEYLNDNSGLWVQIGALLDAQPQPGAMLAVGYTLFGAEVQLRSYGPTGASVAVYGKLRIPIGFLAYELRQ